MAEFTQQDLSRARFEECDFTGAVFHNSYFTDVKLSGAWLERVDIDGMVLDVTVNGVDIGPLVEAELNRRHPERPTVMAVRTSDADGVRAAWEVIERIWPPTIERARRLDPDLLHERVGGEWSFIETLRHLLFVTDAWVVRAVLGEPSPWHPLDLPHDEMGDAPGVPRDRAVRPALDDVLDVLADRRATVGLLLDELTDERLEEMTVPVTDSGYPPPESYPVGQCLRTLLEEEWEHRLYAERDLQVLSHRDAMAPTP